ncbi:neurexin 1-like [Ostrinia nubilalis]|uniref:neurexin 1-like n=1 Tax=Ostrinia nubilalis TaxID=29057 RepID=UPI0030824BA3
MLRFRTTRAGLLLRTASEHSADRIELAVAAGRVRASVRLGDREKNLLAGSNVADDNWHTVRFSRRASNLKLQVDGAQPVRGMLSETILGKASTLEISTLHLGGLFHPEEEIQMTSTLPNFVGYLQKFVFNGIKYIDMAKTLGIGSGDENNNIYDTSNIIFTGTFMKPDSLNVYKSVTFKSKHTYVGLPLLKAYGNTYLDFYFRTTEMDGLLFYNGGKKQDFIAIELVNGHIHCVFNLGDGVVTMKDKLKNFLNDNRWHTVSVRRPTPKIHTLQVDDDLEMHTTSSNLMLELDSVLFVGGVPKDMYSSLPVGVLSRQGFEGCMSSLDLPGESPSLMDDAVVPSSSLGSGCEGPTKCTHNACANKGVCVQQWNTYVCDCDLTSFTGPTCYDESIAYEFGPGRGIITYSFPSSSVADTETDKVALGFVTSKADAVLLRIESSNTQDYMQMEIIRGNLFMVYNVGGGDHPLGDEAARVDDGAYHVARFTRNGSRSALQLDNYAVNIRHPQGGQQSTIFNSMSTITVGGGAGGSRTFSGVIAGLVVDGVRVLELAAAGDPSVSVRGDARRAHTPLDRDINRMQQVIMLILHSSLLVRDSGVIAGLVVDGVRVLELAAAGDPSVSVRGDARRAHTPLDRDINRMQQVIMLILHSSLLVRVSGVIAGLVVDGVRVLELAAAGDPSVSVRGDARRAHTPLDRDINRMQQVIMLILHSSLLVRNSGVIAGLVVDGVRVLELAAAGDPSVSVRGDARRAHTPLDRDINRMQQVIMLILHSSLLVRDSGVIAGLVVDGVIVLELAAAGDPSVSVRGDARRAYTPLDRDINRMQQVIMLILHSSLLVRNSGVIAGLVVDGVRVLELAAAGDPSVSVRGDARRAHTPLDRDINRMQQVIMLILHSSLLVRDSGVIAGLVVDGVRVLELDAAGDPSVSVRGDARRAHTPLDRDINRMQQVIMLILHSSLLVRDSGVIAGLVVDGVRVLEFSAAGDPSVSTPPSGYGGPGVMDELVYSGAGSGCRDDDEDACVLPDAGSGDDLITPVYVPSTRRPPARVYKAKAVSGGRIEGGPGVIDELVYSGAGSGCRDDDEDACVLPDAGSGDDLITPVYVPSTRRPPARVYKAKGDTSGKLMKPCDDEDCAEGSGASVDEVTEPEHPATTSGASSTHSMTSPTASISSTEHVDKSLEGSTDGSTDSGPSTKADIQTTLPDHDNMHAGTVDTATTPERKTTPTDEHTHSSGHYTPTMIGKHTPDETTHTTEEDNHIPDYEDRRGNEIETRTPPYEIGIGMGEQERLPGRGHQDYNGYDKTTKWYQPKSTDNRVVPPESEFFATIVGIVASVLIAIILIVIIVLKYIVFKLDPSYKVTEDKSYQQGASAALLGNQAHSSYQSGASSAPTGGAVRNLQPLPLNRNGAPPLPVPTQPVKRDGIKEWYV